jgi:hypothetical protein
MMSNNNECPICMETIDSNKNIIITDCGHKFHCKCMMENIRHNGFGCPYCRHKMINSVEEKEEEEEDDDYYHHHHHVEYDNDSRMLESMRLLFERVEGEGIEGIEEIEEIEEIDGETDEEDIETIGDNGSVIIDHHLPSAGFVTQILSQRRISYEDLVKCILLENRSYIDCDEYYYEYIRTSNKVNGKINAIICGYNN